ncbi:Rv3212 family protein [Saccharomonospora azurea]|uniref:Rv3212 family protein n=1 Tax=Saccharomonospora azurea TaxID=40988 RepID=UPI003D8F9212
MSTPSGRPDEHPPETTSPPPETRPENEDVPDPAESSAPDAEHTPGGLHDGARDTAGEDSQRARASRRSPWNRRRDRVLATALAVVCVAAGVVVWLFSDSHATTQRTASEPPPRLEGPASVPGSLAERWRADSAATPVPLAQGGFVITGSDGTVAGRDPLTGEVRWEYGRDLELCTVGTAWSKAVAVYRKDAGCSEVTQLDPATGQRTAQRNGDAESPTRLVVDGGHVTTTGTRLINTWRSDLVKTLEYGRVPAPVNPNRQPRPDCHYSTVAAGGDRVGVIEHCPNETGARLTVLKAAGDEADEPEQVFSALLPETTAQLVAMSDERVAVALPERRQLFVWDYGGKQVGTFDLAVPSDDLAAVPESGAVSTAVGREQLYWFTGSSTVALSLPDLRPRWTVEGTLGAGTVFAGEYVVPIPGGLAALDERTGAVTRTVAVDRRGHSGPVELEATGPVLLEQRGGTLVALR